MDLDLKKRDVESGHWNDGYFFLFFFLQWWQGGEVLLPQDCLVGLAVMVANCTVSEYEKDMQQSSPFLAVLKMSWRSNNSGIKIKIKIRTANPATAKSGVPEHSTRAPCTGVS